VSIPVQASQQDEGTALPPATIAGGQSIATQESDLGTRAVIRAPRSAGTVSSREAVNRVDAYLRENAIGLTAFATKVRMADRTLRNFRRTGKIRRDLFHAIKAMGLTPEELMRPK